MRDEAEVAAAIEAALEHVPSGNRLRAGPLWYATAAALRVLAEGHSDQQVDAVIKLGESETSERRRSPLGERAAEATRELATSQERGKRLELAVRSAAENLSELLLFDTRTVINGAADGTDDLGEPRALIEFIKIGTLEELGAFVRSLEGRAQEKAALDTSYNMWASDELADFLSSWMRNTSRGLIHGRADTEPWRAEERYRFTELLPQTASAEAAFRSWATQFDLIRDGFETDRALAPAIERSNAALNELEQNADLAIATAGKAGDKSLANYFATLSDKELTRASWWSFIAAAGMVATVILGATVVADLFTDDASGWVEQLVHLALTLPVAAGTAYASTVASRHRQQAWWSATTAAQLHTFDAFSAPLPDAARAQLRAEFGARMFAEPAFNTHTQKPDSAAVTSAASDLTAAVSELVKRGREDKA